MDWRSTVCTALPGTCSMSTFPRRTSASATKRASGGKSGRSGDSCEATQPSVRSRGGTGSRFPASDRIETRSHWRPRSSRSPAGLALERAARERPRRHRTARRPPRRTPSTDPNRDLGTRTSSAPRHPSTKAETRPWSQDARLGSSGHPRLLGRGELRTTRSARRTAVSAWIASSRCAGGPEGRTWPIGRMVAWIQRFQRKNAAGRSW